MARFVILYSPVKDVFKNFSFYKVNIVMTNFFGERLFFSIIITSFAIACTTAFASSHEIKINSINKKLAALEKTTGGRIVLYAIDTENNVRFQYRARERFPFCSTAKVIVVSAILKKSITDPHFLQQNVVYKKKKNELVSYSPITKNHINGGITVF